MVNQANIEALFDCFDESASLLYKTYKIAYLDGLVITCENIMANSVEEKYNEINSELMANISKIKSIEFDKEEIRKSFQYACLKGFKHANISNQMITPDTIGIFINYLISKLYLSKKLSLLDPLLGTGNLISTIANISDKEMQLIGVDSNELLIKLSNALFDMLNYGDQVFYQDTLTFNYPAVDLIVTDFSGIDKDQIYEIISHQADNLIVGAYLIGIFDEASSLPETLIEKAEGLSDLWNLFGFIKLPSSIFKNSEKNIVIFQRNGEGVTMPERMLLVELPDFTNQTEMAKVIGQLNDWFKKAEVNRI